eukprot:326239-Amphidinium_carterae.1
MAMAGDDVTIDLASLDSRENKRRRVDPFDDPDACDFPEVGAECVDTAMEEVPTKVRRALDSTTPAAVDTTVPKRTSCRIS